MTIRAVLFDFGGTLYDYATLAPGGEESLVELARWAGVTAERRVIIRANRNAMKRVFFDYLPRPYYLHRDLFRDAMRATLQELGATAQDDQLERYRELQWERQKSDFQLRDGVIETFEELRRRKLHVGMVSNIDEDQLRFMLDLSGVEPYFDAVLSSEAARSCKPDPAIFAAALDRAGCEASQTLFVGDSRKADVAGANRAGMQSVLIWHRADKPAPEDEPRAMHVISQIPELLPLLS